MVTHDLGQGWELNLLDALEQTRFGGTVAVIRNAHNGRAISLPAASFERLREIINDIGSKSAG